MIIDIPKHLAPSDIVLCVIDPEPDENGCVPYWAFWYNPLVPGLQGTPPLQGQVYFGKLEDRVLRLQRQGWHVQVRQPIAPYAKMAPAEPVRHHLLCVHNEDCTGECMKPLTAREENPR